MFETYTYLSRATFKKLFATCTFIFNNHWSKTLYDFLCYIIIIVLFVLFIKFLTFLQYGSDVLIVETSDSETNGVTTDKDEGLGEVIIVYFFIFFIYHIF